MSVNAINRNALGSNELLHFYARNTKKQLNVILIVFESLAKVQYVTHWLGIGAAVRAIQIQLNH